jgi:hypothetical protein
MENKIYATFNNDGFLTGMWNSAVYDPDRQRNRPVYGPVPEPTEDNPFPEAPVIGEEPNPNSAIPIEAIELTEAQADEIFSFQGLRKFIDGKVVVYEPPTPKEPVPPTISDRQFFQQLAVMGLITENEALAYVQTGTLPAAFLSFIDQLPADQRFDAKMKLTGANSFDRNNPLVNEFAGMYGMASADVDNLWRAASTL